MKPTHKFGFGSQSSGFYKDKHAVHRVWYLRWWAAVKAWLSKGWEFGRKMSWILSSAFLILILPTLMVKTLEFESMMSNEYQQAF